MQIVALSLTDGSCHRLQVPNDLKAFVQRSMNDGGVYYDNCFIPWHAIHCVRVVNDTVRGINNIFIVSQQADVVKRKPAQASTNSFAVSQQVTVEKKDHGKP